MRISVDVSICVSGLTVNGKLPSLTHQMVNRLKNAETGVLGTRKLEPGNTAVKLRFRSELERSLDRRPPAKRSRQSPTGVERLSVTDCTEKKYVSARQGERYGPEKQKAAFRRGINQKDLSVYALPFENGLFFSSQQKVKGEQIFSMGFSVGWAIDREARKLSGPQRSDKGERMSGAQKRSDKVERSHQDWQERSDKVERSANARATPGWTASPIDDFQVSTITMGNTHAVFVW